MDKPRKRRRVEPRPPPDHDWPKRGYPALAEALATWERTPPEETLQRLIEELEEPKP